MSYLGKKRMEKWADNPKNWRAVNDETWDLYTAAADSVEKLSAADQRDWEMVSNRWLNHYYGLGVVKGELLMGLAIGIGVLYGKYEPAIKAKIAEIREKWKSKKSEPEMEEEES